ncbi:MAG: D-amino-acid transaminase [Pseudomonadota bacterium]
MTHTPFPPPDPSDGPPRVVYVNGAYAPAAEAMVSVFDRGFLFGDGVYEVSSVLEGGLVDNAAHMARLRRSLEALSIPSPGRDAEIEAMQRTLIARNQLVEGVVYLQVSRGVAERSFDWPSAETPPSLIAFTQAKRIIDDPVAQRGLAVACVPDLRWKRRDIKTVNLLPASWAKMQARAAGADDAWMVEADDDGVERVTEGSSNNAYIVTTAGEILTRPRSNAILHGITRRAVLRLVEAEGLQLTERAFTVAEARAAAEAFVTSASTFVTPVTRLDGAPLGDGAPGPITRRLRALYIEMARAEARADARKSAARAAE